MVVAVLEGRVRLVEFQDAQHWEDQRLEELYGLYDLTSC